MVFKCCCFILIIVQVDDIYIDDLTYSFPNDMFSKTDLAKAPKVTKNMYIWRNCSKYSCNFAA